MRDSNPTFRDILFVGLVPTLAAMLVGAALLTERLQTDLTGASGWGRNSFWLLCPFIFGLLHIFGTGVLASGSSRWTNWLSRSVKAGIFLVLHTPWFWIGAFYYVLMSLPVLTGVLFLNIIGDGRPPATPNEILVFLIPASSVMSAGIGYGLLLAILSAPDWETSSKQRQRRLLLAYGLGGALASAVYYYTSGYIAAYSISGSLNPLHAAQYAWLITLVVGLAIMIGCIVIWSAALRVYLPTSHLITSRAYGKGLGVLLAASVCFAAGTHFAVSERLTLLSDNIELQDRFTNFIRSRRPLLPPRETD
ncbi:MAG: hypothetical protein AAF709_10480 [Pseudomonadota bacterium]